MPIAFQLLTVPQAAQVLNLSKAKLYQLIGQGAVETIKIGRSTRIDPEALHEFIREQATITKRIGRGI